MRQHYSLDLLIDHETQAIDAGPIHSQTADIFSDYKAKVLHVRLHNGANRATDQTIDAICKELTATETIFPGTDLKLIYSLVSNQIP